MRQSGKQDFFRPSLQNSGTMEKSSGSQFFGRATGIQSGPGTFDEFRFVIIFLTIFGVTEILCTFRIVLEGETGNKILSH